jgi:hypothetical protein
MAAEMVSGACGCDAAWFAAFDKAQAEIAEMIAAAKYNYRANSTGTEANLVAHGQICALRALSERLHRAANGGRK